MENRNSNLLLQLLCILQNIIGLNLFIEANDFITLNQQTFLMCQIRVNHFQNPKQKQLSIKQVNLNYSIYIQSYNLNPMDSDDDYSLTNVVRHVKYFIQKLQPKHNLTLEYKFAKPNQPVKGDKKFERTLQSSFEDVIIMNADREMNRNNYVHLKSMTYLDEFNRFMDNLQTLQTVSKMQVIKKQKVDLTVASQKVSFDCLASSWSYKNRRPLFRPCYQAVKNGQLFRIGLIREIQGDHTPNKKVTDMIQKTKKKAIKEEKQQPYNGKIGMSKKQSQKKSQPTQQFKSGDKQIMPYDPRDNCEAPFRFKSQQTYHLNKCCSFVMTSVYQVKDVPLYQQMSCYVKSDMLMPLAITNKCKKIFKYMKDELAYEVEFRFDPGFVREMDQLQEEQIEEIMRSGVEILLALAKDTVEFNAEEVVKRLDVIDGK